MNSPLFSLEGRTALVTGAGRGIGRAVALGLARSGADLVLAGRAGSQDETAKAITDLGRSAVAVPVDFCDPNEARAAGRAAIEHGVDVLVNNAGVIDRTEAEDVSPDAWKRVLDVNLTSLFFLTQQVAGPMLQRGSGKIVNLASLLSFQGGLKVASYAASKHAVAGLTRALCNEWASRGVQVNAIAPGYIATDNTRPLREDPERREAISDRIPAGRWGEPDDVVGAAVFLSSRASDYVNGHVLVVDGGWAAR